MKPSRSYGLSNWLRSAAQFPKLAALAIAIPFTGCSVMPAPLYGDVPVSSEASPDLKAPPDLAMVMYPAGPYGNQQGETLQDITFEGYRLAPGATDVGTAEWVKDIKLGDFHANPACKCLLITFGALWCGACQQEQPKLISDVDADPSFCVINIVQEGAMQQKLATKDDVTTRGTKYSQNYPIVQGTKSTENLWNGWAMNGSIGLPFNMIVKPETMAVLDVVQGFDPQIHDNAMKLCTAP